MGILVSGVDLLLNDVVMRERERGFDLGMWLSLRMREGVFVWFIDSFQGNRGTRTPTGNRIFKNVAETYGVELTHDKFLGLTGPTN